MAYYNEPAIKFFIEFISIDIISDCLYRAISK